MQHDDDIAEDSTTDETLVDLQKPDEDTWVHLILGFPYIGGILTFFVAMLPAIFLGIVVMLVLNTESESVINWTMLFSLPITYFWLGFLERKAGLAICLPFPIVNIRIKWVILPLGLFLGYQLLTGQPV